MLGIRVSITGYVSDDPQPGIVQCEFVDAHGRRWIFIEKTSVVSADPLDAQGVYPQPGVIAGDLVQRSRDVAGREIIRVDTERPYGIESVDGVTEFDVRPECLVQL